MKEITIKILWDADRREEYYQIEGGKLTRLTSSPEMAMNDLISVLYENGGEARVRVVKEDY
jgi:hypothetical protein